MSASTTGGCCLRTQFTQITKNESTTYCLGSSHADSLGCIGYKLSRLEISAYTLIQWRNWTCGADVSETGQNSTSLCRSSFLLL